MISSMVETPLLGIALTFVFFLLGNKLYQRWPWPIFTPLFFAMVSIIIFLLLTNISYEAYNLGGQHFSIWVTPATVALAIRIEKNFVFLKRYYRLILIGSVAGIIFHTLVVVILGLLFNFDYSMVASIFPKSITTAIAMDVSSSFEGIVSLTVALVFFTGILGGLIGPTIFKLFKIDDPVAQGVALGTASHALGTSKAIELGDVQAAMASLSIAVAGISVVVLAPIVLPLMKLLFN